MSTTRPCVFIQTNRRQKLGAIVSRYSLQRNSNHAGEFDVQFMEVQDFPFLLEREGQTFRREGKKRAWLNDDLQSFTPLRFAPPELMGYQGRALVIDPDIFAIGDVWELLSRDMAGKAILCREQRGRKGKQGAFASSVMLLDCAKLAHWRPAEDFGELFEGSRDYMDWVGLLLEDRSTIGLLERHWNDLDHLDEKTRLLHNTKRKTQPWKTGLPIDFRPGEDFRFFPPKHWGRRARRALFGDYRMAGNYVPHPDPAQIEFFFGLLRECLEKGIVMEEDLRREMAADHLRHDALEVLEQAPPLTV